MSRVSALGVDVSTKATALVLLDDNGYRDHRFVMHAYPKGGPRRLQTVSEAVHHALATAGWRINVAAVETPLNRTRSWELESCAAVVQQVVQSRFAHAIVLDPKPSSWQALTIGSAGNAKIRSLAHARANGFATSNDNLSDAFCLAEYARELYLRDVVGVAV